MSTDQRAPKRKQAVTFWLLIALVVLLFVGVVAVIAGPLALNSYDKSHLTSIECAVSSVDAGNSGVSAKGAATTSEILVSTQDCGTLSLQWGVTKENREAMAAELRPGVRYAFDIGEGTQRLRGLLDVVHLTPSVYGFAPAKPPAT